MRPPADSTWRRSQTEIKYGGYLRRQDAEMRRALHAEFQRIPDELRLSGPPWPVGGARPAARGGAPVVLRPGQPHPRHDAGRHGAAECGAFPTKQRNRRGNIGRVSAKRLRDRIARRARNVGLDVASPLLDGLEAYFLELARWNRKINLTAFQLDDDGSDDAVDRLLIEPVRGGQAHPGEARRSLIDIGSGGGSPAVPMKLARPDLSLTMVEVKVRKSVFLRQVARLLAARRRPRSRTPGSRSCWRGRPCTRIWTCSPSAR